jgi:hypothetical protein
LKLQKRNTGKNDEHRENLLDIVLSVTMSSVDALPREAVVGDLMRSMIRICPFQGACSFIGSGKKENSISAHSLDGRAGR